MDLNTPDLNQKPFDPLGKIRKFVADGLTAENTEYYDKGVEKATHAATAIGYELLESEEKKGLDLNQVLTVFDSNTFASDLAEKLRQETPSSDSLLGNDSLKATAQIASGYARFTRDLIQNDILMRRANGKSPTPADLSPGEEGKMFIDLCKDNLVKDSLSPLTPSDYKYRSNFDRAIKAVNNVIGLETRFLNFEDFH